MCACYCKAQFAEQRHSRRLWGADLHDHTRKSLFLTELYGGLHQLCSQILTALRKGHDHLKDAPRAYSQRPRALCATVPTVTRHSVFNTNHGQKPTDLWPPVDLRLSHPEMIHGVIQEVGLNVRHFPVQSSLQVAVVNLVAAIVNQTDPRTAEEQSLEVGASAEDVARHGDAEGHADVVRVSHGFEEGWIDVLHNSKAEESDDGRFICGLVGTNYTSHWKRGGRDLSQSVRPMRHRRKRKRK